MKQPGNDVRLDLLYQLGRRIAYLRKEKGFSQMELGLRSSIAISYISELEQGKRNPSIETLSRLASALEVSLAELFRGIAPID